MIFCTAIARFRGLNYLFEAWYLGLTPQALCFRLLRRLRPVKQVGSVLRLCDCESAQRTNGITCS